MTWARPEILAFAVIDLVFVVLLLAARRRTKGEAPCPPPLPAQGSFLEEHPDENGPSTEVLILDLGRAMDAPEVLGPLPSARPERLPRR